MIESLSFTLAQALGLAVAASPNAYYVSKGGSDTAGNGSFLKPYSTVARAITAIGASATAAQPYAILVGPGTYTEAFALDPFQYLVGTSRGSTVISNPAANWIGAGFSAAGSQDAGILNCTIGAALTVDFNAVASPATGTFLLADVVYLASMTFTGANANNRVLLNDGGKPTVGSVVLTLNSIIARAYGFSNTALNAVLNCTAALNATLFCDVWNGGLTLNGTSPTNFASFSAAAVQSLAPTITGDRVNYTVSNGLHSLSLAAADAQFTYGGTVVAGATHLMSGGRVVLLATGAAAPFTWTFNGNPGNGPGNGAVLEIINDSVFAMTVAGLGGITPTVLDGGCKSARYIWFAGAWRSVTPKLESGGSVVLAAGISPFIAADMGGTLAANSGPAILITLVTPIGTLGKPVALIADRVTTNRAAGGGFIIKSLTDAGIVQILDNSVYCWSAANFQ